MTTRFLLMENVDPIIDASPDAVVICDSSGVIQSWNRCASELFGWSSNDAVGRKQSRLLLPTEEQELGEVNLRDLLTQKQSIYDAIPRRINVVNRKGEQFAVNSWAQTLEVDGDLCVISFFRRPLTELPATHESGSTTRDWPSPQHSESSQQTDQSRDEETKNPARNEFLANVTHELRTPMNGILGMTELALLEDIPDVVRDYLLTARDSAVTMLSLINDILDFSRLEVDRLEIDSHPFGIRRVLDDTMRGLSLRAHEKGLELAAAVHADVPLRLNGDPIRLRQMLLNLAGNAIKFTESGEVVVNVEPVRKGESDESEWNAGDHVELHFCISDTGVGIDPKDQKTIFAPFTQVDASISRSYAGTGLGLSICCKLAELMHGKIWVESTPGRGSQFHFTARFQVAAAADETDDSVTLKPEQLAGMRVLIVDDNATSRRILKEIVESWAMRASTADTAEGAMRLLETASAENDGYQILIVDALMPRKDGIELLKQIKCATVSVGASILMMSLADQHLFRKRGEALQVGAYLEKPISPSSLLESIGEAIGQVAVIRPHQHKIETTTETLNILVAEDIPANQKVVEVILKKRGHQATIAHNGREAIDLYQRGRFDLVLMDVQMPILDGLQAAEAIRKMDRRKGRHTPIVAMTAHAMRGDRESFLAAGMDGYLSKPLDAQLLLRTVEQLGTSRNQPENLMKSLITKSGFWRFRQEKPLPNAVLADIDTCRSANESSSALWDPETALRRMGDDRELLSDMIDYFHQDSPSLRKQLGELIGNGDTSESARIAHSLKGLCANFEATAAVRVAADAETACRDGKFADAASLLNFLDAEIAKLSQSLTMWQAKNAR